jgi:hypothetical protein
MHPFAINHIALNCRNAAAEEAFFAKHSGFQRSRTFNAGKPNEHIMLNSVLPVILANSSVVLPK